jgi:hypothetical protein
MCLVQFPEGAGEVKCFLNSDAAEAWLVVAQAKEKRE